MRILLITAASWLLFAVVASRDRRALQFYDHVIQMLELHCRKNGLSSSRSAFVHANLSDRSCDLPWSSAILAAASNIREPRRLHLTTTSLML